MPLAPGTRLGPYEILSALGAGGMGEVYRAHDTRLDREVALKVTAEHTALTEARAAAGLHHPAIAQVFDICIEQGVAFIVSEFVDGSNLRQMLTSGPIAEDRAVEIAAQVADALAAAHAAGFTHRDLKPENIMVDRTGRVRVLDFGLAARTAVTDSAPNVATGEDTLRGTHGYMSPEQVRGRAVDPQTDLFALGAVMHEMLRGRRTFDGETRADVLSAILKDEPARLPEAVSPALRQIVARCLAKEPAARFHSAADLAFTLRTLASAPPAEEEGPNRHWGLIVLAAGCLAIALATLFLKPGGQPVYDITPLTTFTGTETHPSLSKDGKQVAFVWGGEPPGPAGIYIKQVSGGGQPLRISPAGMVADFPAWSPDGSHVAYVRNDGARIAVVVVPSLGGPERPIAQFEGSLAPLDWSSDGKWIAASQRDSEGESLFLISTLGGKQHRVTRAPGKAADLNPAFSPDAHTLVFVRVTTPFNNKLYRVALRHDGDADGEPRLLIDREWNTRSVDWMPDGKAVVVPSLAGTHLQFWRIPISGGEAKRLPIEFPNDGVSAGGAQISIGAGRMAVVNSSFEQDIGRIECRALSPCEAAPFYGSSRSDAEPAVSPDGQRVVFASTRTGYREIWRADIDGSHALQLTDFEGVRVGSPRWSPDGQTVAFDAFRGGNSDIWTVSAEGGAPVRLTTDTSNEYRPSFSHDGQWIYFGSNRLGEEIWKVPVAGGTEQQVTHNGGYEAYESEDGQWLYYTKAGGRVREGVWRMRLATGQEELAARDPQARAWAVVKHRVVLGLAEPVSIVAVEAGNHKHEVLFRFPEGIQRWNFSTSLAASWDGRWLYHSGTRRNESDIVLVENFR